MLDQVFVGGLLTGTLALASQLINKARCYIACKRDGEGNFCPPQAILCGFTEVTLAELQTLDDKISEDSK